MTKLASTRSVAPVSLFFILNFAIPSPAMDTTSVIEMDTLVVRASRSATSVGTASFPVTVLERKTILRGPSFSLDQALEQVSGFSLFRRQDSRSAHPTAQGVSLRGTGASGSSRSLVLLDGVPLNDPFGGWVRWSQVRTERVERVEVLHGGGSQLWGNYALGGMINIITGEPSSRNVTVSVGAGSMRTGRADFSASDRPNESVSLAIDGGWTSTSGYVPVRADQRGPVDTDAGINSRGLGLTLGMDLDPRRRLTLRGGFHEEERDNGTRVTRNASRAAYSAVGLHLSSTRAGHFELRSFGRAVHFESVFSSQSEDRAVETPALDQHHVPARELGASVEWIGRGARGHSPAAGIDLRWVTGKTGENFRYLEGAFTRGRTAGGDQQSAGLYFQDTWRLTGPLQLVLGLRLDRRLNHAGSRREWDLQSGENTLEQAFPSLADWILSPRFGAHYALTGNLSLRGSVYRTFRAPTLNELYRPFRVRNDITEANPDLRPERLTGFEAGTDYRAGPFRVSLGGYWNEIDNSIANLTLGRGPGQVSPCGFLPDGGVCRQRGNLDRLRVRGFEASLDYPLPAGMAGSVSCLFSDNSVTRAAGHPELERRRAVQTPRLSARADLRFARPGLPNALLRGRFAGRQYEDDLNLLPLAGFATFDLVLSRSLGQGRQAFVELTNLTDKRSQAGRSADGLISLGAPRAVFGGLRLSFF